MWIVPQPGERRAFQRWIINDQCVESGELILRQRCDQCIGRQAPRSRAACGSCALQRARRRQDESPFPQRVHQRGDDRKTAIGRLCCLGGKIDHHRHIIANGNPQAAQRGELQQVIGPGLRAAAIVPIEFRRQAQLSCQVAKQFTRNRLIGSQAKPGMAQQAELHGNTDPIAGPAPGKRQFKLLGIERIVPNEHVTVRRDTE